MNQREAGALIAIAVASMPNLQGKSVKATTEAWAMIMPDISYTDAKMALVKLLRDREYPTLPLPGEIVKAVRELKQGKNKPPTAIEAWEEVRKFASPYKHHDWSHPAVAKAVQSIGLNTICSSEYDLSRRFMERYDAIVSRQAKQTENKLIKHIFSEVNYKNMDLVNYRPKQIKGA